MEYKLASNSWGSEEIDAIDEVIESNKFTMGDRVSQFEDEFARYLGVKHCIMTNSGSSANLVAMFAFRYGSENEKEFPEKRNIIVPAVSWLT
ncbi:DegT/DnrJ/EryC1/StrS family aminotransferase [Litoricolaceae bacterium]|nr:DegT/DnrJ/EryC1/StrS family aminotransferase [Litorivicinaceae bacterium]